jgi:hypothetical protein
MAPVGRTPDSRLGRSACTCPSLSSQRACERSELICSMDLKWRQMMPSSLRVLSQPRPGPRLSAQMRPPWPWTMLREMNTPSPQIRFDQTPTCCVAAVRCALELRGPLRARFTELIAGAVLVVSAFEVARRRVSGPFETQRAYEPLVAPLSAAAAFVLGGMSLSIYVLQGGRLPSVDPALAFVSPIAI